MKHILVLYLLLFACACDTPKFCYIQADLPLEVPLNSPFEMRVSIQAIRPFTLAKISVADKNPNWAILDAMSIEQVSHETSEVKKEQCTFSTNHKISMHIGDVQTFVYRVVCTEKTKTYDLNFQVKDSDSNWNASEIYKFRTVEGKEYKPHKISFVPLDTPIPEVSGNAPQPTTTPIPVPTEEVYYTPTPVKAKFKLEEFSKL